MVGLGVGPPCLRVNSEETLLNLIDERAQSARAAQGVTPVGSYEKGVPVRELIWPSVLGEPLVYCLQEPMPGKKSLEYAIQATASVGYHSNGYIMLCLVMWTLILSGWHPGTPAGCTRVHVVSRFGL